MWRPCALASPSTKRRIVTQSRQDTQFLHAVWRHSSEWVISCTQNTLGPERTFAGNATVYLDEAFTQPRFRFSGQLPRYTAVWPAVLSLNQDTGKSECRQEQQGKRADSRQSTAALTPQLACSLQCQLVLDLMHPYVTCVCLFIVSKISRP